jgi:hypothetical protein
MRQRQEAFRGAEPANAFRVDNWEKHESLAVPCIPGQSMIPRKPAPHLMRGGNRFSEKDHAQTKN